jgi:tRNA-Thr(GGU) m(6)t(6)A37 methyltransferase TsaA
MDQICYRPIGIIHSPFREPKGTPVQPRKAKNVSGTIEIFPEFKKGLADLDGFSHIILIYHMHLSRGYSLRVKPFLDDTKRGLFATRAPRRPNAVGLSVVGLGKIEGTTLYISCPDIVDGTPLLDIKPYVPHFDETEEIRIGWLTGKAGREDTCSADEHFTGDE